MSGDEFISTQRYFLWSSSFGKEVAWPIENIIMPEWA